jgi:hypothetical protein
MILESLNICANLKANLFQYSMIMILVFFISLIYILINFGKFFRFLENFNVVKWAEIYLNYQFRTGIWRFSFSGGRLERWSFEGLIFP